MKLLIQIPCFNEADSLPVTLAALPRTVQGFDEVQLLVIDDGSTDGTAETAIRLGVDHVVRHPVNRGLAAAFMSGIEACLRQGADVIVNTDADNQYHADDIGALTAPVLAGEADMVVGSRPIAETQHFSRIKKSLQHLGSWAVRIASRTEVVDAPSGYRAMSREAATRLNVFNSYTYTLETIIQAGHSNLRVISVPVRTNADLRPSRLVRSLFDYVGRSVLTIVRVFVTYRPLFVFFWLAAALAVPGVLLGVRFVYYFAIGAGDGHVQSLILASLLVMLAALAGMCGVLADLIATNRKLLEKLNQRGLQLAVANRAP